MVQDRILDEILEVLEVFAFPPYAEYNVGDAVAPKRWRISPSEEHILKAQTLYYKLKGAIGD